MNRTPRKRLSLPWSALLAAALAAASASCALDTTGYLFTPSVDAPADDGRADRTDEISVDPPADDAPPAEVEIVEIEDRAEEEVFTCTPGELCPDGKLCCLVGGVPGCHETADGCDCGGDAALCTDHGMVCCQADFGIFACRGSLSGCLCDGPEDSDLCGDGLLCCGTVSGGDFLCQPDSEGCFCNPGSVDVAEFCGENKFCCGKPDDQPRCHSDTSGCACTAPGYNPAECGGVTYFCCDRGEGQRCGTEENCFCSTHTECGANRVCCDLFDGVLGVRRCRSSTCACLCSDLPSGNCAILGEPYGCHGIDALSYCYLSSFMNC